MSEETNDAIWRLNDIKRAYPLDKSDEWAVDMAIAALSAEPMRWIPVTERLPEDSGEYLVSVIDGLYGNGDYKAVGVAWFAHQKDYAIVRSEWRELGMGEEVVAWMPLPKPWSGKESE